MTLTHSGAGLSQLMEGTTAGALIPEIVRRSFQDLLEAGGFRPHRRPVAWALPRSAIDSPQRLPGAAAHHPGGRTHTRHSQVAAGQLLPQLPRTPPQGRQGPVRRGDGGLYRWDLHPSEPDSGDQADVSGLLLASHREVRCVAQLLPGALPAQPAQPCAQDGPDTVDAAM